VSKLLVHIHHCIMECNCDSSYDIQLSSDLQLTLTVTSKLSGLPFRWKFHAVPVSLNVVISLIVYVRVYFAQQTGLAEQYLPKHYGTVYWT